MKDKTIFDLDEFCKNIGFTRKKVSELLGISGSSIQMYTDRGIITPKISNPSGRGTIRKYSDENLVELLLIKELQKFGIPLKKIEKIIKSKWQMARDWGAHFKKYKPQYSKWLVIKNPLDIDEFNCSLIKGKPNDIEIKLSFQEGQNVLLIDLAAIIIKIKELVNK